VTRIIIRPNSLPSHRWLTPANTMFPESCSSTTFFTTSPYSDFLTSGLISPLSSSPSSLRSHDSQELYLRRGSLPTDSPPSYISSTTDDASMYYFTLQPKRDKNSFRSFLSLDLAESQSLRSHSTKHKQSNRHRSRDSREPPFAVDLSVLSHSRRSFITDM
jgi:hypothetical protein